MPVMMRIAKIAILVFLKVERPCSMQAMMNERCSSKTRLNFTRQVQESGFNSLLKALSFLGSQVEAKPETSSDG